MNQSVDQSTSPVFIALGSNLGDRAANIREAASLLDAVDGFDVLQVAPLYESAPMYVEDQPSFVNTCLSGRASLSVEDMLTVVKSIESEMGRRVTFRNGPRLIDVDIVYFGTVSFETDRLVVPHPRRLERSFVLRPIFDLAPDFTDPPTGRTIASLLSDIEGDGDLSVILD